GRVALEQALEGEGGGRQVAVVLDDADARGIAERSELVLADEEEVGQRRAGGAPQVTALLGHQPALEQYVPLRTGGIAAQDQAHVGTVAVLADDVAGDR